MLDKIANKIHLCETIQNKDKLRVKIFWHCEHKTIELNVYRKYRMLCYVIFATNMLFVLNFFLHPTSSYKTKSYLSLNTTADILIKWNHTYTMLFYMI